MKNSLLDKKVAKNFPLIILFAWISVVLMILLSIISFLCNPVEKLNKTVLFGYQFSTTGTCNEGNLSIHIEPAK